jgi:peptidoglycan/xylan/chitin deacetylase (PgdA/CDA1 family)
MPRLTLTFDNGPTPGITDQVLTTLAEHQVRATFFLIGKKLAEPGARALARRAVAEGHQIANHTFSHGPPLGLSQDTPQTEREILQMQEALADLAGETRYFRPNGRGQLGPHLLNPAAVDVLSRLKATVVLWSSVPKDRKVDVPAADTWLDEAKRDVLGNEWTLMVLHDRPAGHENGSPMDFLGAFLEWAHANGVEIVQEFPDACIAMRDGILKPWAGQFINGPAGAAGSAQVSPDGPGGG